MPEPQLSCIISEARTCKASASEKLVFIIGSGSPEFSEDVQKVKEILKPFGLEGYFALLSEKETGLDVFCDKICSKILGSLFCIAILNDPVVLEYFEEMSREKKIFRAPRANVYYELGIAVSLKKKITPVIRKDMKLPFDVQHVDVITYKSFEELQDKLAASVSAILRKGFSQKAIKMPKLDLLLIDQEGEPTKTMVAEPVITKIRYKDEKEMTPLEKSLARMDMHSLIAYLNYLGLSASKTPAKHLVPLSIAIWNNGEIPAENVLIMLEFPEGCKLTEESEAALIAHPTPSYGGLDVDYENERIATAWLDRLGNDRGKDNFDKILVNFNTEEERIYEVNATVIQDNYPKKSFVFKIVVKPKIVEETRYKKPET